ncbi:MAG: DUF3084 domain-containing protein [Cyanobacteria bacterium J06639_1]
MQGVLFILVILVLSGLIAYVGDRLGHIIGKKRLSWLNLRPRHTAIVFTVLTGLAISSVTLGLLLTLNRSLADGLFNYGQRVAEFEEQIDQLDTSYKLLQAERVATEDRLLSVRQDLAEAQVQREEAQTRLGELTEQRDRLLAQRNETESKLTEANRQLNETQARLEAESQQLESLQAEARAAQAQIADLAAEREDLQQSLVVAEGDRAAAEAAVADLQAQKDELQSQKDDLQARKDELQTDINSLFAQAVQLRRGEVAIVSGELLAARVIPGGLPSDDLRLAVNNVLTVAETRARQLGAQPAGDSDRAVQITVSAVTRLVQTVQEPGSWLVQVFSITNRLKGEPVPAIAEVKPNRLLFAQNATLAETNVLPGQTEVELEQTLLRLLARANQRSRDAGILVNPVTGTVGEFSQAQLFQMVQSLKAIAQPTQVKAVAAANIYTSGPLEVNLEAGLSDTPARAAFDREL